MRGVDFGWGRVTGTTIKAAGFDFVCRYLSHSPGKNLNVFELADFRANELPAVLVWETTERRCLDGHDAGVTDAQSARQQAKALGIEDPKIYFACDDDFSDDDLGDIEDYFIGVCSVLTSDKVGVYGGLRVVNDIMVQNALAKYGWQTSAWSKRNGVLTWEPKAQLRQVSYNTVLNQVQCDVNESMADDYGQNS